MKMQIRSSQILPLILATVALSSQSYAKTLVYMHENGTTKEILKANADGTNPRAISRAGQGIALYPSITSDGKVVAYSSGPDEAHLGIVTVDLKSNKLEQWTPQDGMYLHSNLSADGRFLAFSGPIGVNKAQRIGIIDLAAAHGFDGEQLDAQPKVQVIDSDASSYFPTLSRSGEFIIFQRSKSATVKDIVKLDLATNKLTALTPADGYAMAPALSFDNRSLVYTSRVGDQWDIYLQNLETGAVVQVTKTPYRDFAPNFTPEGGIIYAADKNGHFELYEIPADAVLNRSFTSRPLVGGAGDFYRPVMSGELALAPAIPGPARSSFGAITHNGLVFVAGGHQGHEHTYPPESFMNRLDIYDQKTKTWKQGANLSMPRHGFGLAAYGKYVYAFGGFAFANEYKPKWKSVDLVERYDIEQNRWEVVAHLPIPRSSNVVARIGDKVYLVGGWDSTPQHDNDAEGRFLDTIDVFDLATQKITTLQTKIQKPLRRALSGVVNGDEILLVGGLGVGSNHFDLLDQVTAFNVKTNTWRELPKLPFPTFAPAAGIKDGHLYVFGGMFKTSPKDFEYVNHIYSLDLKENRWYHTGRYLSEPKGFGMVVDLNDNHLGILGGHMYEGETDHPVSTFENF